MGVNSARISLTLASQSPVHYCNIPQYFRKPLEHEKKFKIAGFQNNRVSTSDGQTKGNQLDLEIAGVSEVRLTTCWDDPLIAIQHSISNLFKSIFIHGAVMGVLFCHLQEGREYSRPHLVSKLLTWVAIQKQRYGKGCNIALWNIFHLGDTRSNIWAWLVNVIDFLSRSF